MRAPDIELEGRDLFNLLDEFEQTLVVLAAEGLNSEEIGGQVGLSAGTINNIFSDRIYPALGIKGDGRQKRGEVVKWYFRHVKLPPLMATRAAEAGEAADHSSLEYHGTAIRLDQLDWAIYHYQRQLETNRKIRARGLPYLAAREASNAASELERLLQQHNSLQIVRAFGPLYIRFLLQIQRAYLEIFPDNLIPKMWDLSRKIIDVATECHEWELLATMYRRQGIAYYISGNYRRSVIELRNSWALTKRPDAQLWVLRPLATNWVYLGEVEQFKATRGAILKLMDRQEVSFELWSTVCEALARCEGILGLSDPFGSLQTLWYKLVKLKQKYQQRPFLMAQCLRSYLEVIHRIQPQDKQELMDIARDHVQGLTLDPYRRHHWLVHYYLGEPFGA